MATHVGGLDSMHNRCVNNCEALMKQKTTYYVALMRQSDRARTDYRTRLQVMVDTSRILLL